MHSRLDESVNFPLPMNGGIAEARYVRRDDDEVIVYLSSQTGCRQACRFCHLTQTGQTDAEDVDVEGFAVQARTVLGHYRRLVTAGDRKARTVNFNFMARGDALASQVILTSGSDVLGVLADAAEGAGLIPRFKISTILPRAAADRDLAALWGGYAPDLYVSLYSMDPNWRRRWMPKACPPDKTLAKLVDFQQITRKIPVLHWALIAGENDSEAEVELIVDAVVASRLRCDINLVAYNPYSPQFGAEPPKSIVDARAAQLARAAVGGRVQVVGRVGMDVAASCGMFIAGPSARRPATALPVLPSSDSRKYLG